MANVQSVAAILLISDRAPELAEFYRGALGIPLEDEQHGETHAHFGCELGGLHFAIHPPGNFDDIEGVGRGACRLAFSSADVETLHQSLKDGGTHILFAPKDMGWCKMMAFQDPDGNAVEIVQMR